MRNYLLLLAFCMAAPASAAARELLVPPVDHPNSTLSALGKQLEQSQQEAEPASGIRAACERFGRVQGSLPRGVQDDALLFAGYCRELLGDYSGALEDYEKSLAARANNPIALYRAGRVLEELKRYSEAIEHYREVSWRLKENLHEPLYRTAVCYMELEDTGFAAKFLKKAITEKPDFAPALRLRNELRRRAIEELTDPAQRRILKEKMIADYRTVMLQQPEDAETGVALARLLIKGSDPVFDAERLAEAHNIAAALVKKTEYKKPDYVRLFFDVLLARRLLDEAKQLIQRALTENPSDPQLLEASLQLEIELGAELASREDQAQETQE